MWLSDKFNVRARANSDLTDFNVPFKVFRFVHRFSCIILHIYGTNSLVLLGVNTSIPWAIEFSILAVCWRLLTFELQWMWSLFVSFCFSSILWTWPTYNIEHQLHPKNTKHWLVWLLSIHPLNWRNANFLVPISICWLTMLFCLTLNAVLAEILNDERIDLHLN